MNTFNYLLSDFVTSNLSAAYGSDYYVDNKKLIVPLSSTWMANVTSIETVNNSLCSLNLTRTLKLSSITINENNLVNFYLPNTNISTLCAFNLKSYSISLTSTNTENVILINCPQLRSLNVSNAKNIRVLYVLNNPNLSAVYLNPQAFNSNSSNTYITFVGNSLTEESVDHIYGAVLSGYVGMSFNNGALTISNPVTGTNTWYSSVSGLSGLNVNVSVYQPFVVLAEK